MDSSSPTRIHPRGSELTADQRLAADAIRLDLLSAPYRSLEKQFRFSKSRAELSKVGDAYRQVKVVVEQLVVSDVVPRLSKRTTELAEFGDADNTVSVGVSE